MRFGSGEMFSIRITSELHGLSLRLVNLQTQRVMLEAHSLADTDSFETAILAAGSLVQNAVDPLLSGESDNG